MAIADHLLHLLNRLADCRREDLRQRACPGRTACRTRLFARMSGDGLPTRTRRAAGSFGALNFPRDARDEYETPIEAVERLLQHESFPGGCWDSSTGRGDIVRALRAFLRQNAHRRHRHRPRPRLPRRNGHAGRLRQHRHQSAFQGRRCACPPRPRAAVRRRQAGGTAAFQLDCSPEARADLLSRFANMIIVGRLKMLPPGVSDLGYSGSVDFAWFVFSKVDNNGGTRIVRPSQPTTYCEMNRR